MSDALSGFHPATAEWFRGAFTRPTAAQEGAWSAIGSGGHTLVVAPTGSGKTLCAFLTALDRLHTTPNESTSTGKRARPAGTRVVYISPLKALAVDVERNLRAPLAGISARATALELDPPAVTVGVRTGDTPAAERRAQRHRPPDILVTTPESLYLLLTSAARDTLTDVDTVIVDEIHAVAGTKRGAHLALSLERLDDLTTTPVQRIGLSATVQPHSEVARFLAGERPVTIVAPESDKRFDLSVQVPVADLADLSAATTDVVAPPGTAGQGSLWPHVERQVVDLITAHRSTIVFVNSRRLAERLTARINEIHAEDTNPDSLGDPPARPPAQIMAQADMARGAPAELAKAHHGSVAKERRSQIEDDLKSGHLRAVVATSSLELGIDMGDVDLVVQVESPPSVASGLQRVGRAGHHVGQVSRAVLFPKHRADLVHCSVTVERMLAGAIEHTTVLSNPLDVLAQHTVAACSLDDVDIEHWFDLVRRAAPYASLSRDVFEATIDMLAGKYPSADFAELRPRLLWDRDAGVLQGRPGAQRLAVTSGGTIPDRGLFGVFMVGEAPTRVGELDEEMVYESRVGDVIALGASSWRIESITHDRVLVAPAPGGAGRLPFWLGDANGRPAELGAAMGQFLRELSAQPVAQATSRLRAAGLNDWAAENLVRYLADQRLATGTVAHDTTLLVERFRDELGDWRVILHSPYGARVHWPWAEALRARIAASHGVDVVPVVSDDGIILRIPDGIDDTGAAIVPGADLFVLDADEATELVTRTVGDSALFASRFRECSARALLLPRLHPGKRAPLWQQRLKSAQLLDVARRFPDFPIVLEAVRECLQDVYDVPALRDILTRLDTRAITMLEVETATASPFAQSMLFNYVGSFVYEGDAPLAEKRAAALSIDPLLLGQLLGKVELRELLDDDIITDVERKLQHLDSQWVVNDAEGIADLLRILGPLDESEIAARAGHVDLDVVASWTVELARSTRAVRVDHAGHHWWVAVEDLGRLRDGLGIPTPPGIPSAFLEPVDDPLAELVGRYARTHGPFTAADLAQRFGLGVAVVRGVLERLAAHNRVIAGEFCPGTTGAQWCDVEVLRRIRKRSLAALRSEIEPVSTTALARFLPHWHQRGDTAHRDSGIDGLLAVIEQLDGLPLPASALEPLILAPRLRDYTPALLDELISSGEVVWCGRGVAGARDGWVSLHPVDTVTLTVPEQRVPAATPLAGHIIDALGGGGLFFRDLVTAVRARATHAADNPNTTPGEASQTADLVAVTELSVRDALWELVWAGHVTNDTFSPVRAILAGGGGAGTAHRSTRPAASARRARFGRRTTSQLDGAVAAGLRTPPILAGRWSLVPVANTDATLRAHTWAETLLIRHGVVTRGAVEAEEVPGGFAAVYKVLATMEDSGVCRRGYFIDGLGATQFAAGATIDQLRIHDDSVDNTTWPSGTTDPVAHVLAATDPANPYGGALAWPEHPARHRPGRKAGALVVLVDGILAVFVERGGKTVLVFDDHLPDDGVPRAAAALATSVTSGVVGALTITTINGDSVHTSSHTDTFTTAGFSVTPKGLRLRQ